jgi:hypothetical protein
LLPYKQLQYGGAGPTNSEHRFFSIDISTNLPHIAKVAEAAATVGKFSGRTPAALHIFKALEMRPKAKIKVRGSGYVCDVHRSAVDHLAIPHHCDRVNPDLASNFVDILEQILSESNLRHLMVFRI